MSTKFADCGPRNQAVSSNDAPGDFNSVKDPWMLLRSPLRHLVYTPSLFYKSRLLRIPTQNFLLPTQRYHNQLLNTMYPHHSTPSHISKVLVFGAGNFGSCLADHLGDSEHQVYMWSRDAKFVKHFNFHHRNPDYLKDHLFSHNIQAVGPDLPDKEFIKGMEVLLFAIPTQAVRYLSLSLSH